MPWWGWMLIVIAIALVIIIVLYIVGNRLQKKQAAQKEAMLEAAQPVTMLVIDKKNAAYERRQSSKTGNGSYAKAVSESKTSYCQSKDRTTDSQSDL